MNPQKSLETAPQKTVDLFLRVDGGPSRRGHHEAGARCGRYAKPPSRRWWDPTRAVDQYMDREHHWLGKQSSRLPASQGLCQFSGV